MCDKAGIVGVNNLSEARIERPLTRRFIPDCCAFHPRDSDPGGLTADDFLDEDQEQPILQDLENEVSSGRVESM